MNTVHPINHNIANIYPYSTKVVFHADNKTETTCRNSMSAEDYRDKIIDQNERLIKINAIQAAVLLVGSFLINIKLALEIFNKKSFVSGLKNEFKSLADDKKIPKLDECKSISKNLKEILQRQINCRKYGYEITTDKETPLVRNRFVLSGPPGVGKSFFAKVFAKTINADFMEISYKDVNSEWAGKSSDTMIKIFDDIIQKAKQNKNKDFVLSINEIDSFAISPDGIINSKGTHWISKVEERSVFLDYLEKLKDKVPNVTIIASTNVNPKNGNLDRATLSRLGSIIEVDYPDANSIYEALKVYLQPIKNSKEFINNNDSKLKSLADTISRRQYSYRNLEEMVNNAIGICADKKAQKISNKFEFEYLEEAQKNIKYSDGELENHNYT